jgi:rieske iron-sulfur protein
VHRTICRRALLKTGLDAGLMLALRSSMAANQDGPPSARLKEGDFLVRLNDATSAPLTPGDIAAGALPTSAWPMDPVERTVRSGQRFNQLLLVRVDPAVLASATRERAVEGIVAYTSVCTHSGCDVDDWLAGQQLMSCSCHSSVFDPKDSGRVLDGPAPRPLPALPLKVVDGKLAVAGPFTARVGFEPGA